MLQNTEIHTYCKAFDIMYTEATLNCGKVYLIKEW